MLKMLTANKVKYFMFRIDYDTFGRYRIKTYKNFRRKSPIPDYSPEENRVQQLRAVEESKSMVEDLNINFEAELVPIKSKSEVVVNVK